MDPSIRRYLMDDWGPKHGHDRDLVVNFNDARGTHFRCSCGGWTHSPGNADAVESSWDRHILKAYRAANRDRADVTGPALAVVGAIAVLTIVLVCIFAL